MKNVLLTFNEIFKTISEEMLLSNKELSNILKCNISLISLYKNNKRAMPYESVMIFIKYLKDKQINVYDYIFTNKYSFYHGSRQGIKGNIDCDHCTKSTYDFGKGFYLGETFKQSSTFISSFNVKQTKVYGLKIDFSELNILDLSLKNNVDYRWIMFIAYNRRHINKENYPELYNSVKNLIKGYDVIKGLIADDKMAPAMERFFANKMSVNDLMKCLTRMKLGNQYCFINNLSCNHINNEIEISFDKTLLKIINDYEIIASKEAIEYADKIISLKRPNGDTFLDILEKIKKNKWIL